MVFQLVAANARIKVRTFCKATTNSRCDGDEINGIVLNFRNGCMRIQDIVVDLGNMNR